MTEEKRKPSVSTIDSLSSVMWSLHFDGLENISAVSFLEVAVAVESGSRE